MTMTTVTAHRRRGRLDTMPADDPFATSDTTRLEWRARSAGRLMSATVLIVEDEFNIGKLVRTYLERDGYGVVWVSSGEDALVELRRHDVDLVVLDVGLPGIDGFEVCRRVRAESSVPVIMLTARDEETDRVVGLELGADDYVPKPFSPRELVARVKAVLRRTQPPRPVAERLTCGAVELRADAREASRAGVALDLTMKEFDLLACFLEHAGLALTREQLLEQVWGLEFPGGTRTVDQHVAQLRAKLGEAATIETLRGVGYKLVKP
jgi:DNA-binding response OmpR family regulator